MDDPLFAPWSTDDPAEASVPEADGLANRPERTEPVRWRSPEPPRDAPVVRPAPEPVVRPKRPSAEPAPPVARARPSRPSASPLDDALRSVAGQLLDDVAARLEIAGHRTLVDDRLDTRHRALRFRLIPRLGPFDEPPAVAGSVLEIGFERAEVVARFWLDPLSEEPAGEERIDPAALGRLWVERVVLDFVERALRR